MRKIEAGLRASTFLVVLSGYLGLSTTNRYSLGVVAIPVALLALMPLGEWLDGRFARYRTATSAVSIVYVTASLALIPFMDLLVNVVNLVIFIQAYAFLHRKQPRDYLHLLLMSFFMMLAASVLMPDPEIGAAMLLFLLCAIAAMVMLHIQVEMAKAGPNGSADILPLDEHELSLAEHRHGFDLGVVNSVSAIAAAAIGLTVVLFISIPRMEAGLLGRNDPTLFRTGVSQTVDLAQGGRIDPSATAIMRVEFPEETGGRFNGPMFWRCASLDYYQDPQWQRKGLTPNAWLKGFALKPREILDAANRKAGVVSRNSQPGKRVVRQVVYIQEAPAEGVPALTLVQRMQVPPEERGVILTWDRSADYSILLTRRGQRWLQYEAWSEIDEHKPELLRAAPDTYRSDMSSRDYDLLTFHTLQPRSVELVRQITQGKTNTYDKVAAIAAYLSQGGFQYSLDVPALPKEHPVDAFLHDVRTGHCELFASAMALMVRSLGIPARVVSGYRGAEWSDLDGAYTIREDMAHLWVEVYFIGVGWVTFDPSPADAQVTALSRNRLLRFLSRQALVAKMLWYRNVISFDSGAQITALRTLRTGFFSLRGNLFDWGAERTSRFRPGPAFAALLVLLVLASAITAGLVGWARATASGGYALTADQARAVTLYRRLLRKLERAGIKCKGLAAEEIQDAVHTSRPAALPGAAHILLTYNEVRFGGRPLPPQPYHDLAKRLRQIELR
ncbi:MAG: transglutaminaseTgpA domain-containing protein [Candidatus Hydrogenedentes bacterium]|nr:transglutaminaseTgpA domain-containing protein [Candidatus Hydrogenedentota bacterium]